MRDDVHVGSGAAGADGRDAGAARPHEVSAHGTGASRRTPEGGGSRSADAAAVAACADGDPQALEDLYARHAPACLALARSILRDRDYAEDAVQEAYLDVWRHAARFDSRRSSVRSWLLLVTRSKAIDRVRHEDRRRAAALPEGHDCADERRGPEAHAVVAVLATEIRAVLSGLPAAKREALVLAYWGGYTQREIAGLTGAPLGTVKSRMLHAMLDLRSALDARALDGNAAWWAPAEQSAAAG